ncbi:hypothetical protein F8388_020551 [Cannabis sativa]|uniref:RNase H type-1 domain-containing protein n=1 Tax=Cannabis sativa TaxID=3483 RepID=A0A7J6ERF5_CANSA|nr:hypothetical protein F8388_020551 [Cannabis sativa]KAF4393916.1 hypothetical protein G4B88_025885 [Cannabis sativa]
MEEVTKHFHEEDVSWIQGIPIDLQMEDTLIWPYTPNGNYIVKSGYRIGRELNLHPTRCSNMEDIHKWWKMMWSMQLPPRMKLFGWRVCQNWLPSKTNLSHRGMTIHPSCDLCGNQAETLTHALWSCSKIKPIWKLVPWYKHCEYLNQGSMFDILVSLKAKLNMNEFEDAIKIMWAIWENRNRKWNNLHVMNGAQLLDWVFSAYPGSSTPVKNDMTTNMELSKTTHWIRPPAGYIAVNCDAAMNSGAAGIGTGFIWRNWDGKLLIAGMNYSNRCCSVDMAEAWAILEALNNMPNTTDSPMEIQSDCKHLVDKIMNQDNHLTAVNTIIHQIRMQMEKLNCNSIVHVNRNNNECAHMLARKCLATKTTQIFTHPFPRWLAQFCTADSLTLL